MSSSEKGLKAVATLEASKGAISLIVALGLHTLAGDNLKQLAESLVTHAHLNPASHYPSIFIHAASGISGNKVNLLALGVLVYALVRFIEAYGLWKAYRWVEWFSLLSGAIYLPFEIYGMIVHPGLIEGIIFVINILVVWYMAWLLLIKKHSVLPS